MARYSDGDISGALGHVEEALRNAIHTGSPSNCQDLWIS
jgi:hypothetical protein